MDARKLETTRDTALDHVQRCTPTCPSSTSCRFRRARRKLREGGKPCTHARAWYTRFALEVPRIYGCSLYTCASGTAVPRDLAEAANDAALLELLIDSGKRCQADSRALIEEANLAAQPGPGDRNRGLTQAKLPKGAETCLYPLSSRPEVGVLMRLTRRENKLINRCRAFRQAATDASSPEELPLAEFMQHVWEIGGQDIHDAIKESNPDLPDDWCLPGQSRFIRPKPENGGS